MHAHFEQVEWGPIYLAAGVTTVRDCGNEFEFIPRRSRRDRRRAAASVRGCCWPASWTAAVPMTIGVERVDTPEQAAMWTDEYHDARLPADEDLQFGEAGGAKGGRRRGAPPGHDRDRTRAQRHHCIQAVEAGQDQINHMQYIADIMQPPLPDNATRAERRKRSRPIST